ncbi:phosphatidylinositol-binding clathrin assembly protein-like isoform X2 [Halichondria panicea]|uniref:phosphatidylinositol-binding clathrin assembly protein-like isoform X2 n=1 Tax=Halichondria panicea TaxID=6063 RepID=UPI00312B8357
MSKAVDRATAFYNEVAGQGTYKIICKASNHDLAGPKKKHVDALLQITNNPVTRMSVLADLISERLKDKNWVVAFKTLIVSHNLMSLGHEKFMQCMATRSNVLIMEHFNDRSDHISIDMSVYLRKYANYLICMCTNYRTLAMDINKMPKGDNSPFKNMDPVKILKAATNIQKQLDTLLEVEISSTDLTNGVINTAFLMLYKDLVKLYTVYNDIMINLLEKFFEMKKSQCRETIEFYRRFLTRQEGVQAFLQLSEQVGIDSQTHLNLRQVPEDLLPALENHLSEMDALKKTGDASPSIRAASEKLAALKSAEKKSVSPAAKAGSPSSQTIPSASTEVLEAQRKRFEDLKRQASVPRNVEVQQTTTQSPANDLLGLNVSSTSTASAQDPWKSSIPSAAPSNPFQPVSTTTLPVGNGSAVIPLNDPWGTAPAAPSAYQEVDLFTEIRGSEGRTSFDAVFSSNPLLPSQGSNEWDGGILRPQAAGPLASQELLEPVKSTPGLGEDVESSLAMAAANLSMYTWPSNNTASHAPSSHDLWAVELGHSGNKAGVLKKTEHQWTPAKESVRTGGNNFQRQGIQARTLTSQDSMKAGAGAGAPVDWNKSMYGGHFPQQYPSQPMGPPTMMGPPAMMGYGMMPPQQPFGMQPVAPMMQSGGGWYPGQQPQGFQQQQQQPNDPFGAIPSQNKSLF